jgi:hypothetical protein
VAESEGATASEDAAHGEQLVGLLFWAMVVAALVSVLGFAARHVLIEKLYDDAFIFQRYAMRLLADRSLAWNPGGPATYGLTSPLFLLVAAPMLRLCGGNPGVAALASSGSMGLVFLALGYGLVTRLDERNAVRRAAIGLVLFCMVSSSVADHFFSGMETTFALCHATAYLLLLRRTERQPDRRNALMLGAFGGVVMWVRPELAAFSVLVPALWSVAAEEPAARRAGRMALALTLGLLLLSVGINQLYFGSALPLSFYVKSTSHYAGHIYKQYRGFTTEHLALFVGGYWPLLLLAVHHVARLRPRWRSAGALCDLGLFAAVVIIAVYHWLAALPVMSYSQRFLYPTLPALVFVATRALGQLATDFESSVKALDVRLRTLGWSVLIALMLAFVMPPAAKNVVGLMRTWREDRYVFDMDRYSRSPPTSQWIGLAEVSALPDDLVLAATEVGLPGALNPNKVLIDLAGLNERMFAQQRFSAARLFEHYRPDFFYLPHSDYVDITTELLTHPAMADYLVYREHQLKTGLGVALRRDSPHFDALRRIVAKHVKPKGKP